MLQLSTPLAETDNRAQEQLDGTPEESLLDDAENLSEHDEDTPVTEDCSLSLSLQQKRNPHKSQRDLGVILCETAVLQIFFAMTILEIQVTIPTLH